MEKKGKMTVGEAGQKGGETTAKKYGKTGFYKKIGKKGGDSTSAKYGLDFYQEIGRKGGQKVKELIKKGKESNPVT